MINLITITLMMTVKFHIIDNNKNSFNNNAEIIVSVNIMLTRERG